MALHSISNSVFSSLEILRSMNASNTYMTSNLQMENICTNIPMSVHQSQPTLGLSFMTTYLGHVMFE